VLLTLSSATAEKPDGAVQGHATQRPAQLQVPSKFIIHVRADPKSAVIYSTQARIDYISYGNTRFGRLGYAVRSLPSFGVGVYHSAAPGLLFSIQPVGLVL
jgi:hypothetical protein